MKCTACNSGQLTPSYLEGALLIHECNNCGGILIYITDFLKWKDKLPLSTKLEKDAVVEAQETTKAMICPVTGSLMTKFKISHDSEHKLDYSSQAAAVWLDKGEWSLLKEKGLALELSKIFTSAWQHYVRSKESEVNLADMYQEEFGEADYRKARDVKNWLNDNPNKERLIAYLLDENPYN